MFSTLKSPPGQPIAVPSLRQDNASSSAPAPAKNQRSPRSVSIFGATGSIGCNTLDLIRRNRDLWNVEVLTGNHNIALLAQQAREFRPALAITANPDRGEDLRDALAGSSIATAAGPSALIEAASRPVDLAIGAITGAAGLDPMLVAIRHGAMIGLANKECLVCAGTLFIDEINRHNSMLLPIDSEHNAVFQLLDPDRPENLRSITLTASGGPFRCWSPQAISQATPADAIAHPTWSMGAKISVDSATLMNKGLELIEAHYLFKTPPQQLDVIIHPQSLIHCLVSHIDGSTLIHMGQPDMRIAIASVLAWPERMATPVANLDLASIGQLTFEQPDRQRFPALALAENALHYGGAAPAILNAANEIAVEAFLAGHIGFNAISALVEDSLDTLSAQSTYQRAPSDLTAVRAIDCESRRITTARLNHYAR